MDILLTVKLTSRQLRLRRSPSTSVSPQLDSSSTPSSFMHCNTRRLALHGAPAPYFVVNPHLFEDPQLWPTERLRQLCSEFGCSPYGSRSALVGRLQDLDWDPTTDAPIDCFAAEDCVPQQQQQGGDEALSHLPLSSVCTAEGMRAALEESQPAAVSVKPVLMRRDSEELCSYDALRMSSIRRAANESPQDKKTERKQQKTDASSADSAQQQNMNRRRGTKRRREESTTEMQAATSPRKQIKFCPFNNVQLITTHKLDYDSKETEEKILKGLFSSSLVFFRSSIYNKPHKTTENK